MDVSFFQLYYQLSEKHGPHLEAMRKSIVRKSLLAALLGTALAVWLLWIMPEDLKILNLLTTWVIVSILLIYTFSLKRPYVSYFRENVAKSFVALVDPSLSYSPEPPKHLRGKILAQYHTAQFDGRTLLGNTRRMFPIDKLESPFPSLGNFITGVIERRPFQLCCMQLTESGSGSNTRDAVFVGMFVRMNVSKNLIGFIKVERKGLGDDTLGSRFIPKEERQKMDHVAFEKDFSVGSSDQITAMQYLTADVMELILNFKNELFDIQTKFNKNSLLWNAHEIRLDFFWQGDEVLMRIGNRKMFIPTRRDPMCKDSLACCLSSLRFVTKLNHAITKSIKETAI